MSSYRRRRIGLHVLVIDSGRGTLTTYCSPHISFARCLIPLSGNAMSALAKNPFGRQLRVRRDSEVARFRVSRFGLTITMQVDAKENLCPKRREFRTRRTELELDVDAPSEVGAKGHSCLCIGRLAPPIQK